MTHSDIIKYNVHKLLLTILRSRKNVSPNQHETHGRLHQDEVIEERLRNLASKEYIDIGSNYDMNELTEELMDMEAIHPLNSGP